MGSPLLCCSRGLALMALGPPSFVFLGILTRFRVDLYRGAAAAVLTVLGFTAQWGSQHGGVHGTVGFTKHLLCAWHHPGVLGRSRNSFCLGLMMEQRQVKRSGKLWAHGGALTRSEHPRVGKCSVGARSQYKLQNAPLGAAAMTSGKPLRASKNVVKHSENTLSH